MRAVHEIEPSRIFLPVQPTYFMRKEKQNFAAGYSAYFLLSLFLFLLHALKLGT